MSLSHTHLFSYFLSSFLISLNPSLCFYSLLFFPLTITQNLSSLVSQSFFPPLLSIPYFINILLSVLSHICVSLHSHRSPTHSDNLCPPFYHTYLLLFSFSLSLSLPDPEQSVQELVYDLRSQCDAIRVTKTVRPYRMVICPVNENNAALTVSDGRVMLWELKAHTGRAPANPRYTHTVLHTVA